MQDTETVKVKVWDIWVRTFHWSLVVLFVIAYFTAEEENILHIYSGYAVLGLVIFRMLWGFVGSKYARFCDFIYPPKQVIQYIQGMVAGKPEHYLGHNPLGGWMTVALLAGLLVVSVTGLKLYANEEGRGPLASTDQLIIIDNAFANRDEDEDKEHSGRKRNNGENDEEMWEELHEVSTNITLLLILLHILGVFISSRLHHENLVKAMITGNKERQV